MDDVSIERAGPDDLEALLPLVAAYHAFERVDASDAQRRRAIGTLLSDPSLGFVLRVEQTGRVVGYLAVCFGYSIEFGGRDAFVDELFLEPAARGRGIGALALERATRLARDEGALALHLEVERGNEAAQRTYERHGFSARPGFYLMSLRLDDPSNA